MRRAASSPSRIACLLVPGLPLAAELRARPELVGRPLAIVSGPGPRAEVLAASPEARARGVRLGQTVVNARAACGALEVRPASPALERAARDALCDAALSTSPRVALAPAAGGPFVAEAAVFSDARGVDALFQSERGFAGALCERARRLGLPAVVAVAGSRGVARIAARQLVQRGGETTVIAPGEDARFLAPLPLDLLDPSASLADALGRFGLHRVGELLALSERALTTRLGEAVRPLLRLARGEDREPPPPVPPGERFEEASDLENPVQHLEPLLFVLHGLLTRLAERLACRGLALDALTLELSLEGGGRDARRVGMAAPTLDVKVALRLLQLAIEARPPEAAIDRVALHTPGREVRGDQLDFFRPAGPTPARLSRTLAELTALCGEGRVGAPGVADEHRPDAYAVHPFVPPAGASPPPAAPGPVLAVRALRPPVPAQVRAPHGTPEWIASGLARGDVVRCAGPWRTTGHWWNEEARYAFDHFDVQTADGWVVRLRHDWIARSWQIDGIYD